MSLVPTQFRRPHWLPRIMRRVLGIAAASESTADGAMVAFRCNLCGADCRVASTAISREEASCRHCGSTLRMRAVAHLLTTELLGHGIALPDLKPRQDIRGIGLSDSGPYVSLLEDKL